MRRRAVRVRQRDSSDCAAACLASVAAWHGLRLPVARIRQLAGTDARGTTALGLVRAAEALGFRARGVRAAPEAIADVPLPAIAHVTKPGGRLHFVVLHDVLHRGIAVMDPASGRIERIRHEEWASRWTGVLVLLVPGDDFRPGGVPGSPTRRFWQLVRPHRTVLAQALLGAAVYTVLGLSTAVFVQNIVDRVLLDGDRRLLDLMGIAMLALLALQTRIGVVKGVLTLGTGQRIDAALVLGYYRHLLRLPQRFFDTMRVGEIISRVNDAVKIRAFVNDVALELTVDMLIVSCRCGKVCRRVGEKSVDAAVEVVLPPRGCGRLPERVNHGTRGGSWRNAP